jgi:hypothetical protein
MGYRKGNMGATIIRNQHKPQVEDCPTCQHNGRSITSDFCKGCYSGNQHKKLKYEPRFAYVAGEKIVFGNLRIN